MLTRRPAGHAWLRHRDGQRRSVKLVLPSTPRTTKDGDFEPVEPSAPSVVARAVEAGEIELCGAHRGGGRDRTSALVPSANRYCSPRSQSYLSVQRSWRSARSSRSCPPSCAPNRSCLLPRAGEVKPVVPSAPRAAEAGEVEPVFLRRVLRCVLRRFLRLHRVLRHVPRRVLRRFLRDIKKGKQTLMIAGRGFVCGRKRRGGGESVSGGIKFQ